MSIDKLPSSEDGEVTVGSVMNLGGLGGLQLGALTIKPKARRGRPKHVSELDSIDCYRAWAVQGIIKAIRRANRKAPSTREVIQFLAKDTEAKPFNVGNLNSLEQSVSRGKKKLGISSDWKGGAVGHDGL